MGPRPEGALESFLVVDWGEARNDVGLGMIDITFGEINWFLAIPMALAEKAMAPTGVDIIRGTAAGGTAAIPDRCLA
jgi:hypothetical protein